MTPPLRQIRASYDDDKIVVYQAYSPVIAEAAVAAGTFVPPFKLGRMTWIKPSFLWMMYRSGWATKPGQERVLAIHLTRAAFEQALALACLSQFDPAVHSDHTAWRHLRNASAVRVQWDPERTTSLDPLPWRCIQIGLGGQAVHDYVTHWITDITDITDQVWRLRSTSPQDSSGQPSERAYPLPPAIARSIGIQES